MKEQGILESSVRIALTIATSVGLLACLVGPATAQSFPIDPAEPDHIREKPSETQSEGLEDVGRTANTGIGEVGERTRVIINADPTGRLNSRIQNRVRNRIRNRIDRDYDPMANATSPFEQADQQTRRGAPR